VGTAFTYQGQLQLFGAPANGTCNMQFSLWDALSGPTQVGGTLSHAVTVTNGVFSAPLDFGGGAFTGNNRWLEISVDCPGGGGLTVLSPRQPVTASPYALFANTIADNAVTSEKIANGTILGQDIGAGTVTQDKMVTSGPLGVQRRIIGTCAVGTAMIAIQEDGSVSCQPLGGDISSVTAGTGLTGGGLSGDVTLNVALAGSGVNNTVSRSDHDHFNQSWSGSAPFGLEVINSSDERQLLLPVGDN
jgi:hypothetical protein